MKIYLNKTITHYFYLEKCMHFFNFPISSKLELVFRRNKHIENYSLRGKTKVVLNMYLNSLIPNSSTCFQIQEMLK